LLDRVIKLEDNVTKILNNQEETMNKHNEDMKKTTMVGYVETEEKEIEIDMNDVMFLKEVIEYEAMVLDTGCPKSLVRETWLEKYLKLMKMTKDQLQSKSCSQKFRFGSNKVFEAKEMVEIPINVKTDDPENSVKVVKINAYVVEAENVPLLCGRNTMMDWEAVIDMKNELIKIEIENEKLNITCINTEGGHMVVKLLEVDSVHKDEEEEWEFPSERSKSKEREVRKDTIGAYWLTSENSKCFNEAETIFVVEVPVKYHKHPDIIKAKETEIQNLKDFDTFEEVEDIGQLKVRSRWVITGKEKHDGQKKQFKARLVAKGFQEEVKPQADSPTALKESFKMFNAIAANEDFDMEAIDI
jgi:hypothetical protein